MMMNKANILSSRNKVSTAKQVYEEMTLEMFNDLFTYTAC